MRIEHKAIEIAKDRLISRGYSVQDVSHVRGHNGYDLLAKKPGEILKIEVKACSREWQIPDPYVTEFDADRRLVADYLYVVYFIGDEPPKLCAIPRDAINPDFIKRRIGFRISSKFKKKECLGRFIQE